MRLLLLGFLFFAQVFAFAQNDDYAKDVKKYLTINGTHEQYADAFDQLIVLLKKQYETKQVPETVWTDLEKEKGQATADIKAMLVSAYRGYFSQEDIKHMIALYQSDAGKQLTKDPSKLTEAQKEALATFYNTLTGQRIIETKEGMANVVSSISESWSGALYQRITSKLKDKGY